MVVLEEVDQIKVATQQVDEERLIKVTMVEMVLVTEPEEAVLLKLVIMVHLTTVAMVVMV